MRRDGSPAGIREALAGGWGELALYLAAAIVYVAIGIAFPEFLFAWVVAVGYLLAFVVLVPVLVRLLRR